MVGAVRANRGLLTKNVTLHVAGIMALLTTYLRYRSTALPHAFLGLNFVLPAGFVRAWIPAAGGAGGIFKVAGFVNGSQKFNLLYLVRLPVNSDYPRCRRHTQSARAVGLH